MIHNPHERKSDGWDIAWRIIWSLFVMFLGFAIGGAIYDRPPKKNILIKSYGSRHQMCYPNETCKEGFECIDKICIKPKKESK